MNFTKTAIFTLESSLGERQKERESMYGPMAKHTKVSGTKDANTATECGEEPKGTLMWANGRTVWLTVSESRLHLMGTNTKESGNIR